MMTKEEIARDYRLAKDKNAQVGILAELNCCSKEEIIEILVSEGAITGIKKKKESPAQTKGKSKRGEYKSHDGDDDIIRWYNEGMKMTEIAERLGLTFYVVQKRIEKMKKNGIVNDRGPIKKGRKKTEIEVVDYKEDKEMDKEEKIITEGCCYENGNTCEEKTIPQSANADSSLYTREPEREIGSINIDTGKVSIWISFR